MVAAVAFTTVIYAAEVSVGIVAVAPLEQAFVSLTNAVRLQVFLFVVLLLAVQ